MRSQYTKHYKNGKIVRVNKEEYIKKGGNVPLGNIPLGNIPLSNSLSKFLMPNSPRTVERMKNNNTIEYNGPYKNKIESLDVYDILTNAMERTLASELPQKYVDYYKDDGTPIYKKDIPKENELKKFISGYRPTGRFHKDCEIRDSRIIFYNKNENVKKNVKAITYKDKEGKEQWFYNYCIEDIDNCIIYNNPYFYFAGIYDEKGKLINALFSREGANIKKNIMNGRL